MRSRRWVFSAGVSRAAVLITLSLAANPVSAGGNFVVITAIHGRVEMKPLRPGAHWMRAKPGLLGGAYLLRTGPRSWVHLAARGDGSVRAAGKTAPLHAWAQRAQRAARGENPGDLEFGCVDGGSLIRVVSTGTLKVEVLRGQVSAVDGRRGRSLGRRFDG
jgi:hypothetical protein